MNETAAFAIRAGSRDPECLIGNLLTKNNEDKTGLLYISLSCTANFKPKT